MSIRAMIETKSFPTLSVMSASTGILVCELYDMYNVLNWMLDDSLMTHQMPNASRTVQPYLEAQYPWLAELDLPAGNIKELVRITKEILDKHGETLLLERPENHEWVRGNGLTDMLQLADGRPVFQVSLPEASSLERMGDDFLQINAATDQLSEAFEKLAETLEKNE
jgi:hypothetical protein